MNRYFFFNDPATTEIYTLSLHDALPIWPAASLRGHPPGDHDRLEEEDGCTRHPALAHRHRRCHRGGDRGAEREAAGRSEEHTSELQSRPYLVCRLLLEKKNTMYIRSALA